MTPERAELINKRKGIAGCAGYQLGGSFAFAELPGRLGNSSSSN